MTQKMIYTHIKNFKGIKELEVDNMSRFVAIFGNNAAGKTSFLEAIKNAIKLEKGWNSKVRIGEEKGMIEVHFEDFKIKRIIGENGRLEVEHNGELVNRPQERLDNIFLWTIGDPQKFLNLHNKEKIKYILETQGKETQYDALEEERMKLYEERSDIHKRVLSKEQEVNDFVVEESDWESVSTINIADLQTKLSEINIHNQKISELESRREKGEMVIKQYQSDSNSLSNDIVEQETLIAEYERKIANARNRIEELEEEKGVVKEKLLKSQEILADVNSQIDSFKSIDPSEITKQITEYSDYQSRVGEAKAKKEMHEKDVKDATDLRNQRKDLDTQVKEVEERQNALIHDLDISYKIKIEEGIMYVSQDDQWIALDDLNTAAQLDLWVDICLSGPNKIKIITIENANSLDPSTMEKIKAKIEAGQAQCFLETVYKTGYESITIEDWEIKQAQ